MVDASYLGFAWFIIFWGSYAYVPSIRQWSDNHPVLAQLVFWVFGSAVIVFISV